MNNWKLGIGAIVLTATLVACPNPEPAFDVATTDPAADAPSVPVTSKITVTFNKATAKATSGVFNCGADLAESAVTIAWPDDKTLVVTPKASLAGKKTFTCTVTSASSDGTATATKTFKFTTANSPEIVSTALLDGTVFATEDGNTPPFSPALGASPDMRVGTNNDGNAYGVVSFDLSTLPATFTKVTLRLNMTGIGVTNQDPFALAPAGLATATDKMILESLFYGTTAADAKKAYSLTDSSLGTTKLTGTFATAVTNGAITFDVTNAVKADISKAAVRGNVKISQFRLRFPTAWTGPKADTKNLYVKIATAENTNAALRPVLVVE